MTPVRRAAHPAPPDPERLARDETDAWVGYYRHEWTKVLRGAFGMVRHGFGTNWWQTLRGAWLVLRANQVWAPVPDNDPDAARAYMARFYRIVARVQGWTIDPQEAARREVDWWRVHREIQRVSPEEDDSRLVEALTALYGYVYTLPADRVRPAAVHRAAAMRLSDAWVEAGCDPDDERLVAEYQELLRSYTALRNVVAPPGGIQG